MENNTQNQDPYVGLYADALGRGVQTAQPVAAPNQAQMNMQSMRPQGGLNQGLVNASPSFLGGPNGAVAQGGQEEQEEQEGQEEQTENYMQALFNGETLSEAFREKAKTIFAAALNEKVSTMEQAIFQANLEVLQEEVTKGVEEGIAAGLSYITESVDSYLTEVGREWLVENKLEVESGFRTEIAENFMNGLKDLFENSFMEVPEEKRDIVDDLFNANNQIEASLNSVIEENVHLKSALGAQLCAEQFTQIAEGLTQTDVERLANLSQGIEFNSVEQYTQKVQLLKESYFGKGSTVNTPSPRFDTETPSNQSNTTASPLMESYVNAISRQIKLTNIKK